MCDDPRHAELEAEVERLRKALALDDPPPKAAQFKELLAERDRYKAVVEAARQMRRHRNLSGNLADALDALDQPVREEGEKE